MRRLLLAIALGAITHLAAADLSGRWTGTMETNSGSIPVFVTLKQQGQTLAGTMSTGVDSHQTAIQHVELQGDSVNFEVLDNAGRAMKFSLKLAERKLKGEARVGDQVSVVTLSGPPTGTFRVGGGVTAPVLIAKTEPEYSEAARAAKFQGTVLLYVEIDPSGAATNIRVSRSLGLGLDEKAIEAVKKWRFKPGMKDGTPVTVAASIEVNFRL